MFIEYKNHNHKPTGISITTSKYYIFVDFHPSDANIKEHYYIVKTKLLKELININNFSIKANYCKNAFGHIIPKKVISTISIRL